MLSQTLYKCVESSKKTEENLQWSNDQHGRWQRILDSKDDKLLWKAINWKGEYEAPESKEGWPTDSEFKDNLEALLNPIATETLQEGEIVSNTTVPILDNLITPMELEDVIKRQLKPEKGCGPDGITPGIFELLPAEWITFIATLFCAIFTDRYPESWNFAKLKMLFKKGSKSDCNNYRGISLINSISKLYDYVLCNRLTLWFKPHREQAGAQSKRGCLEHIVTLRLLMDLCVRKKKKMFIIFVDFSKAYDRVPRKALMETLRNLGCGRIMLQALISMYKVSKSILGMAVITAIAGVRQGSPTSCFLFTIYINNFVRMLKERCDSDGFLGWMHTLLLMDDMVIMATNKDKCIQKATILLDFCQQYGMVLNESKTKIMVVNSTADEIQRLEVTSSDKQLRCTIEICNSYTYLGSIFTSDGKVLSALQKHVENKQKHLLKFVSFLRKNADVPFNVKKKVFNACFVSSLSYGCESWINVNTKIVERLYHSAIKALLNVRITTANDLCLAELELPKLQAWIKNRQSDFFRKMMRERDGLQNEDPLMHTIELVKNSQTSSWKYIEQCLNENSNLVIDSIRRTQDTIREKAQSRSKFAAYLILNPSLECPPLYDGRIPEHMRIEISRLRLISHNLKIETGRWSRIEQHRRLCQCGEIQTEQHVVETCTITEQVREKYADINFEIPCVIKCKDINEAKALHEILNFYK